ncbi:MAG: low molecular weight phosphotyrosine protein phosphatase [Clostridiales bacterium]|nr:low molecular weight phosphotyrosine protein phosphatase [Clostridiales bacterium]
MTIRTLSQIRILFICHGNICRSPMAEFVMKDLVQKQGLEASIHVASAATSTEELGNPVHSGTKRKLSEYGISCKDKTARQITRNDYGEHDYLIVMDDFNLRNMRKIIQGDPEDKVSKLLSFCGESGDIADPWYTGDFDLTYQDVLRGCTALMHKLLKNERG